MRLLVCARIFEPWKDCKCMRLPTAVTTTIGCVEHYSQASNKTCNRLSSHFSRRPAHPEQSSRAEWGRRDSWFRWCVCPDDLQESESKKKKKWRVMSDLLHRWLNVATDQVLSPIQFSHPLPAWLRSPPMQKYLPTGMKLCTRSQLV